LKPIYIYIYRERERERERLEMSFPAYELRFMYSLPNTKRNIYKP